MSWSEAIGGYFELELGDSQEYHRDAIRLNTGRNALEYILRVQSYKKVYMPFYTCDVLWEPLEKLQVAYEFYHIDEHLEPVFDFSIVKNDEAFLYTNYFGFKDIFIEQLAGKCANLIVDNAQSFYSRPITGIDTFYSPRKFFGVPDGGYLYSSKILETEPKQDQSYERFEHLVKRIDLGAQAGYKAFSNNDRSLHNVPILKMSNLTRRLLASIDYDKAAVKRRQNFANMHAALKCLNEAKFVSDSINVPMVYPFLAKRADLRAKLIEKHIFTAQYWPNVLEWASPGSMEHALTTNMVFLPIDQRYDEEDIKEVIKQINEIYEI